MPGKLQHTEQLWNSSLQWIKSWLAATPAKSTFWAELWTAMILMLSKTAGDPWESNMWAFSTPQQSRPCLSSTILRDVWFSCSPMITHLGFSHQCVSMFLRDCLSCHNRETMRYNGQRINRLWNLANLPLKSSPSSTWPHVALTKWLSVSKHQIPYLSNEDKNISHTRMLERFDDALIWTG